MNIEEMRKVLLELISECEDKKCHECRFANEKGFCIILKGGDILNIGHYKNKKLNKIN